MNASWSLLGNGPSISEFSKRSASIVVAFNRVDKFLTDNNYYVDIYVCVSDNVLNDIWGYNWCESLITGVDRCKVAILTDEQIAALKKWKLIDLLDWSKVILVDDVLIEPTLYSSKAFPFYKNYLGRTGCVLSKTGTSINVGYCLAAIMRAKQIHLFGCDLNWQKSTGKKNQDRNHYFKDYQAKINSPRIENIRMDFIHLNFSRQMANKCEVINQSSSTIIEYFYRPKQNKPSQPASLTKYYFRKGILIVDENIRTLKRLFVFLLRVTKLKK